MNDVVQTIKPMVTTYERLLTEEIKGGKIMKAEDTARRLEFWCEHLHKAVQHAEWERHTYAAITRERGTLKQKEDKP